jgi:hypothetical protein
VAQNKEFTSVAAQCKRLAQAMRVTVCKTQDDRHVFALRTPDLDRGKKRRDLGRVLAAHQLIQKRKILWHGCFERRSYEVHKTVIH